MSDASMNTDTGTSELFSSTVKPATPSFITRSELPSHTVTKNIGILGVLKHAIGKDLSRLSIPIVFNEPLSMLQRLAEYMEYYYLLDQAGSAEDPVERIELVTAFALSTLASSNIRLSKPFNPLLGETFELCRPDLGFEFVAEQVSHHPPISALFCRGKNYELEGTVDPKVKFWGRSIEVHPNAFMKLRILDKNETYSWQACDCTVSNIIIGKMYMSLHGQMVIKCPETDLQTIMKFRGPGKNGPDVIVTGEVVKLQYYHMTYFSMALNEPVSDPTKIPPTDSRFRPDIKLMENGDIDEASSEKERLEEKQRAKVKANGGKEIARPLWFDQIKENGTSYVFNGRYFDRDFTDSEDIF
ncbi:hypothetical protein FO519_002609 [Halicephalobus sp. NKZ332]|nr:hypothetical protein FO519_002609 [Halicephalobus sp. NKZ332]